MRQVVLGIFLGFILIDLAFDLDALEGRFDAPQSFYFHRNETIPSTRMTVLLQLPLLLVLLSQLYGAVQHRTWRAFLSLVLSLGALGGGNHVMGLRAAMSTANPSLLQQQLVEVAWTHVVMLPLVVSAMFLHSCALPPVHRKQD